MSNFYLHAVRKSSTRDEFYTHPHMVEAALQHLPPGALAGKHVHLPCNDGMDSAFTRYFIEHFTRLGIARLTALSYSPLQTSYLADEPREPARLYSQCRNSTSLVDVRGDGGWQSELGLGLIKEANAIFTNPPFSELHEFINALDLLGKEFAIIVPITALGYKEIYPIIYSGKAIAHKQSEDIINKRFLRPDGSYHRVPYSWLSTFRLPVMPLPDGPQWSASIADLYPTFDQPRDFIRNVKGKYHIPRGYYGWLAVPINVLQYDLSEWEMYHKGLLSMRMLGKELFRRFIIKERRASDAPSSANGSCPSHRTMALF